MALITTDTPRFSQVVKYELEPSLGITRNTLANLTVPAGGWTIGMVLDKNGALLTKANTANAFGVVIDPNVSNYTAGQVVPFLLMLDRGPSIVAQQSLIFDATIATAADIAAAVAVLDAKGIRMANQL